MRYPQETKDRARELRRSGRSVAQIASELGVRSTSTVQDWVRSLPPPEWTRRPHAKDAERLRARGMRAAGHTYDEIARELCVSKSSVSLWTRDLDRPEPSSAGSDRRTAGLRRYVAERRARVAAERASDVHAAQAVIGDLSDRELLIAGAVAYWAEGTKRKAWRPIDRVVFVNSDIDMIRLFLSFLRMLGVDQERIRLRLSIHVTADIAAATSFWSAGLGVPSTSFQRPTLKRHAVSPGRRNVAEGYHGCLVVGVLRSATENRRIEGIWSAVAAATSSSLDAQSRVV